MPSGVLNTQEEAFVNEYLVSLNSTQAAIKAGYAQTTANKKSWSWVGESRESCPENKRHVWDAVMRAKEDRANSTKIDAAYVLKRHKEIDEMDVMDILLDDMSGLKPLSEWPKSWRTSICGIDISELYDYAEGKKELSGLIKKIKWPDKVKNLETLGKHVDVQAYKDRVDLSGEVTSNIMLVPTASSVEDWENDAKAIKRKKVSDL